MEYIQHRTSTQRMRIHLYEKEKSARRTYLQSRDHLAFFLTISGVVEVLHGDEWGKTVVDSVICSGCQSISLRRRMSLTLHGMELVCPTTIPLQLSCSH